MIFRNVNDLNFLRDVSRHWIRAHFCNKYEYLICCFETCVLNARLPEHPTVDSCVTAKLIARFMLRLTQFPWLNKYRFVILFST